MAVPIAQFLYASAMASIAVIGAGAVGCYYGAMLARAGHDVRFLMRRDLAAVRAHGLDIRSYAGDFRLKKVAAFATPEEIGPVDWVICSLKATALEDAPALIRPCLGPETRLVAIMNGLGVEDSLAASFPRERIFGVMAFVCINRGDGGVVHHLRYGRLTIGHAGDDPAETARLGQLLVSGGLDVVVAPDLRWARWEKLCWNIPFNGLSVAAGGVGTELITADPLLRAMAGRAMHEVVAVGNADLASLGSGARLDADEVIPRMFSLTDTMGDYHTSMALDYVAGQPLEVETILGNPARRAAALGIPAPTIDALYALVHVADRRRRGLVPTIGGDRA
jgi:2-dehydropantoate 2-reductase